MVEGLVLMNQHQAVKQQAITWTDVDQDPWCHMASLCHNELMKLQGPNEIAHQLLYGMIPAIPHLAPVCS